MSRRPDRQVLTDDDVRMILLAPPEVPNVELAHRIGVGDSLVWHIRKRKSFRALSIARDLGLLSPAEPRKVWNDRGARPAEVSAQEARRA